MPLPETFESELMKAGIAQLRPIINQYLQDKPIFLPEDIAPLVAYPEVFLNQTTTGLGFVQILSYCTCSDFQAPGAFSKCDERSGLCTPKVYNRRRRREAAQPGKNIKEEEKIGLLDPVDGETLPEFATFLNKSLIFHKVTDVANNFIENHFFNSSSKEEQSQRDTMIISRDNITPNLDTNPVYLVQYETSDNCSMQRPGDNAKTYRLAPKDECTPITVGQKNSNTNQYYVFKPDGSRVLFGCFDKQCKTCTFDVDIRTKDVCIPQPSNGQSFVVSSAADSVHRSLAGNNGSTSVSIFLDIEKPCEFVWPASEIKTNKSIMLASTYELGFENQGCREMQAGGFASIQRNGVNSTLSRAR